MTTSRDELARKTRKNVTDTAAALFLKRGFKATTIRSIASTAGVSVGTVIGVGGKSSLLVLTFDTAIAEIHNARSDRAAKGEGRSSDPPRAILELFAPFLDAFARNLELAREYAAVLVSGQHESVIFTRLAEALREEITEVLAEAGVDRTELAERAMAIYLAYIGTIFVWAASGSSDNTQMIADLRSAITQLLPPERWLHETHS